MPLTGEFEIIDLPSSFEQTSAIVLDGDQLVLFGRHGRSDRLSILLADIAD